MVDNGLFILNSIRSCRKILHISKLCNTIYIIHIYIYIITWNNVRIILNLSIWQLYIYRERN